MTLKRAGTGRESKTADPEYRLDHAYLFECSKCDHCAKLLFLLFTTRRVA
jgi:hypothetical protein